MNQKVTPFRISGARFVATLVCSCIGAGAQAAWVTDVNATADSRYDDNIRLSTDGEEESAIATTVGGEWHVRNVTETSSVDAVLGAQYLCTQVTTGPTNSTTKTSSTVKFTRACAGNGCNGASTAPLGATSFCALSERSSIRAANQYA